MNDELMNAFLCIVKYGSISAAAENTYTTQSRLSKQLQTLEDEIGAPLIIRGKGHRSIELTSYGKEFLILARQWEALSKDFHSISKHKEVSPLSIGAIELINSYTLTGLYQKMLKDEPDIRMDIHTHHSKEIYDMVSTHVIDLGYVYSQYPASNLIITPLYQEEMLLLCNPNDKYEKITSADELDPSEEIYLRWSSEFAIWHDQLWPGNQYKMHASNSSMIGDYLDQPGRWAIVPVSAVRGLITRYNFAYHVLKTPPPKRICYQVENRNPQISRLNAIETFKRELIKYIKKDPNLEPFKNI